jgi:hypothetical protein
VTDTIDADRSPIGAEVPPRRHRLGWRKRLILSLVGAAMFASTLGYLIDDQISVHERFDRAHTSLMITHHRTATVVRNLAVLRHDVAVLTAQVASGTTTWSLDTAQLKSAQAALAVVRAEVSQQSTRIGALHTCLGGVQQALNALAINNQATAVSELSSVASSCAAASGA